MRKVGGDLAKGPGHGSPPITTIRRIAGSVGCDASNYRSDRNPLVRHCCQLPDLGAEAIRSPYRARAALLRPRHSAEGGGTGSRVTGPEVRMMEEQARARRTPFTGRDGRAVIVRVVMPARPPCIVARDSQARARRRSRRGAGGADGSATPIESFSGNRARLDYQDSLRALLDPCVER
jgi:hypothetical protein